MTMQSFIISNISPEEAKKRLDSEKGIVLLDVRSEGEYKEKHIKGSRVFPLETLENSVEAKIPDKNTTIFVYCNTGNKSRKAAELLTDKEYTNVYDLGGIVNWPYETE